MARGWWLIAGVAAVACSAWGPAVDAALVQRCQEARALLQGVQGEAREQALAVVDRCLADASEGRAGMVGVAELAARVEQAVGDGRVDLAEALAMEAAYERGRP